MTKKQLTRKELKHSIASTKNLINIHIKRKEPKLVTYYEKQLKKEIALLESIPKPEMVKHRLGNTQEMISRHIAQTIKNNEYNPVPY